MEEGEGGEGGGMYVAISMGDGNVNVYKSSFWGWWCGKGGRNWLKFMHFTFFSLRFLLKVFKLISNG